MFQARLTARLAVPLAMLLSACGDPNGTPTPSGSALPMATRAVADCQLTMGWDPWEPYHYLDVGGVVRGVDVELVSAVAAACGCELTLVRDDFSTLLVKLQAGEVDVLTGATPTPNRQRYASFSAPYREEKFQLFVRREEQARHQGASLKELLEGGLRIGFTAGYYYNQELEALEDDPAFKDQLVPARTGAFNVERLLDYEIDGFIEDQFVAAAMVRRRGLEAVISEPLLTLSSKPVRLMMSRASVDPQLAKSLDVALAGIRASGRHEAIVERYLGGG